tara:strand:- start:67 stop:342 length:276 start_codon:yes stop_codon:yes gene_type:complete
MHEQIVTSGIVKALNGEIFNDGDRSKTFIRKAIISFQGGNLRYFLDGTNPTTAIGLVAVSGDIIELDNLNELKGFRCINVTTSVTLDVQYS